MELWASSLRDVKARIRSGPAESARASQGEVDEPRPKLAQRLHHKPGSYPGAATVADAHIHIQTGQPLAEQSGKGHNRWHPDISAAVRVAPGSTVEMQTLDGLDGQVTPSSCAEDLLSVNMARVHPLTGPVHVEGAEPGDLLAVRIEAIETASTGFTMIMPGFGFLRDHFPNPHLVHWEMSGGYATSKDLPGIRIPGAPFMGVMGVAPSYELLTRINPSFLL